MRKFLYAALGIIVCCIFFIVGYILIILNVEGFLPPQIDNKTTIDIWNNTNEEIDNLVFIYDTPQRKLILPTIKAKERIIYLIDTEHQSVPKSQLLLQTDNEELLVINDLRRGIPTEAIIEIYHNKIYIQDLSYQWFRYKNKFYYKKFNRII